MRIAIGCDEAAHALKMAIIKHLESRKDIEIVDFGSFEGETVLYPDVGFSVAKAVAEKKV